MSNLPSDHITINKLKETLYAAVITLWRNVYMLQTADMVEVQHFGSLRVKVLVEIMYTIETYYSIVWLLIYISF
jgi:hypothetical protein